MQALASVLRGSPAEQPAAKPTSYWFGVSLLQNMLDRFDHCVFLLDAHGALLFHNQRARDLLEADGGLAVLDSKLSPTARPDQANWSQALRDALAGKQPMLRLHHCPQTTFVLLPIAEVHGSQVRMIMVTASKPRDSDSQTVAGFGRLYRLTRTEVQILHQLANGASAQEVAQARGVAIATVRTHIKNLLNKTGLTGLRQLQAALAQLPAVHGMPALAPQGSSRPIRRRRLSAENSAPAYG